MSLRWWRERKEHRKATAQDWAEAIVRAAEAIDERERNTCTCCPVHGDASILRETLELIDTHGCENYTRGRCLDEPDRSRVSAEGTATQWCDACRARDALNRHGA